MVGKEAGRVVVGACRGLIGRAYRRDRRVGEFRTLSWR
jgi:hypothetical protein